MVWNCDCCYRNGVLRYGINGWGSDMLKCVKGNDGFLGFYSFLVWGFFNVLFCFCF